MGQAELIIYSTPLCAPCDVLKRILTTEGLSFEVKDLMVDEAAAELMDRNGIRTVPVLGINGALHHGDALRSEKLVALLDFE
jgi:glutaredoxin-like protein NrdH|tara:strand:+ start:229 stop:474 length:246 start_codon:yes stop_codon:yes gene_type:complete